MSSYISNMQLADQVAAERRQFADRLRAAAGSAVLSVVRIEAHCTVAGTRFHNVHGWTAQFEPVQLSIGAQAAVSLLMRERRQDIDWTWSHEYHLDRFMLRRSPGPGQLGHRPSVHRLFAGQDPVFLPRIPAQRTSTEGSR